jgi:hypothetical protein
MPILSGVNEKAESKLVFRKYGDVTSWLRLRAEARRGRQISGGA